MHIMFLTNFLGIAMFDFIRAPMEFLGNAPWASVSIHELSSQPTVGLRFCHTASKDHVSNIEGAFARALGVDVLMVIAPMMVYKFLCNQAAC